MSCTWKGCKKPDEHLHTAADGKIWATLCPEHEAEFTRLFQIGTARAILAAWANARYGAKTIKEVS